MAFVILALVYTHTGSYGCGLSLVYVFVSHSNTVFLVDIVQLSERTGLVLVV
jgi:hypothetical protein